MYVGTTLQVPLYRYLFFNKRVHSIPVRLATLLTFQRIRQRWLRRGRTIPVFFLLRSRPKNVADSAGLFSSAALPHLSWKRRPILSTVYTKMWKSVQNCPRYIPKCVKNDHGIYQNVEKCTKLSTVYTKMWKKCKKWPQYIPKCGKVYKMTSVYVYQRAVKFTKVSLIHTKVP
jgi:hypothetical protein